MASDIGSPIASSALAMAVPFILPHPVTVSQPLPALYPVLFPEVTSL